MILLERGHKWVAAPQLAWNACCETCIKMDSNAACRLNAQREARKRNVQVLAKVHMIVESAKTLRFPPQFVHGPLRAL